MNADKAGFNTKPAWKSFESYIMLETKVVAFSGWTRLRVNFACFTNESVAGKGWEMSPVMIEPLFLDWKTIRVHFHLFLIYAPRLKNVLSSGKDSRLLLLLLGWWSLFGKEKHFHPFTNTAWNTLEEILLKDFHSYTVFRCLLDISQFFAFE